MKVVLFLLVGGLMFGGCSAEESQIVQTPVQVEDVNELEVELGADPANTTYVIEGERIPFTEGVYEREAAPGSATVEQVRIFETTEGDVTSDGIDDAAVILTWDKGGSGTFFYLAAALQQETGYLGTNAIFLGDRIKPQSTQIEDQLITVNYGVEEEDAELGTITNGVSRRFMVEDTVLVEQLP